MMEAAIAKLLIDFNWKGRISASGRTDAGVHALAQPFHLDVPEGHRLPIQAWVPALNGHLPASLRVLSATEVAPNFHARYAARRKTYEYLIERAPVLSPFLHGRVWHVPSPMDAELLREAWSRFVGRHDFSYYACRRGNEPDPIPEGFFTRDISSATMQEEGSLLRLRVTGNGFLYRMVRLMVGSVHHLAKSSPRARERTPVTLPIVAENGAPLPSRDAARHCAPPEGLYLHSVEY